MEKQLSSSNVVFQTLIKLINSKLENNQNQSKLIEQIKANAGRDAHFYQGIQQQLKTYLSKNWNFLLKVCPLLDNTLRKSILDQLKIIDTFWKTSYETNLSQTPQILFTQILKKLQQKVESKQKNSQNFNLNFKDFQNIFKGVARQQKISTKDFQTFITYIENFEHLYELTNFQNPRNDMYPEEEASLDKFISNIQRCKQNHERTNLSQKELQQTSYSYNCQKSYLQNVDNRSQDNLVQQNSFENMLDMSKLSIIQPKQKKEQKQQNQSQIYSGFVTVHKSTVDETEGYINHNTYKNDYTSGKLKPSENRTLYDESVTNSEKVEMKKTFDNKY